VKKLLDIIVSFLLWISGLLSFAIGSLLILLVGIFTVGRIFDENVKRYCRVLIRSIGIRVKPVNPENYQEGKQYILMMNHVNMFDPFLFYGNYPGIARGIEEESHFDWPLYGKVIRRIGQIPINRKSGRKALETLSKARELLSKRKETSVMILPEGTRSKSGKLQKFKKGGFLLAIETGLPILPLIQKGAYKIKKKGKWLIRPGKVEYIFETPIPVEGYTKENIHELMDKTRQVFLKHVD